MANFTCVVDAKCLIDHVQEIKGLVYGGEISLHIPNCTFENVEKAYQSLLLQKESQKEPPSKKLTVKASGRKEQQPLFDLNPRIAREFLLRSQSKTDQAVNDTVTFQLPDQQFTQWKNEEEKAIKAEQPPEQPPSSFAQALLRKLNIVEEDNGPKAPAKPRLVAKDAAVNKTPWKYHKVPAISSAGVPASLKPLISCMLWRLHEYENNPLKPQSFVLATDDKETIALAKKLSIPLQDIKQLGAQVAEKLKAQDTRNKVGQAEIEFGLKISDEAGSPIAHRSISTKNTVPAKDQFIADLADVAVPVPNAPQPQTDYTVDAPSPDNAKPLDFLSVAIEPPLDHAKQPHLPEPTSVPQLSTPSASGNEDKLKVSESVTVTAAPKTNASRASGPSADSEKETTVKLPLPLPSPPRKAVDISEAPRPASEDEDSEVDIVVFKPKSRPGSSYIKKAPEVGKLSPPKSYTQAIVQNVSQTLPRSQVEPSVQATSIKYEALPPNLNPPKQPTTMQEPILEEPSRVVQAQKPVLQKPTAPLSYTAALETGLPKKAPAKPRPTTPVNGPQEMKTAITELPVPSTSSHLVVNSPRSRPQTPKSGHLPGQNGISNQHRQSHDRPRTPRNTPNPIAHNPDHRRVKRHSPPRFQQIKTIHSRSPSGEPTQVSVPVANEPATTPEPSTTVQRQPSSRSSSSNASSNKGSGRAPSEEPSNTQKPGHHRPKRYPSYPRFNHVTAKAQRAAQHQPTTTPIIIDADSFDRSSYVKPQFSGVQAHNANANAMNGHHQHGGVNGNARHAGGRGGVIAGRAVPRNVDGDVDFVLKSGNPRGRGRGTGRLWIP